jgi:hypothetical protein
MDCPIRPWEPAMTAKEMFLEQLRRQKQEAQLSTTNVAAIRDEWVRAVTELVKQVEAWLKDATVEGLAKYDRTTVDLVEERLGAYQAPGLRIQLPGSRVELTPRARFVAGAGAMGRVDMDCGAHKALLIRTEPTQWQVTQLFPFPLQGDWSGKELSEESFLETLKTLIS